MSSELSAELATLLTPVVANLGLDLEDVEILPAGRRKLVRVLVDKDGGVDLDAVAEASQAISDALDEANPMGETAYVLEVSSPGVDRPLTQERHWRRNVDRLVKVSMKQETGSEATKKSGHQTFTGRVKSVNTDDPNQATITLDVDGKEETINLNDVARAVVQVEFGRE